MRVILDACAMIAYLRDEPGADVVEECFSQEPPICLAHAVTMCEVFYDFLRASGEAAAKAAIDGLRSDGVFVREDMDEAFWTQVGRYKVSCKVSLADAFIIVLAERYDAEVITSDRREFTPVAAKGVCRVRFIR